MVKVSKEERLYLEKQGVKFTEGGLCKTTSKHSSTTYYMASSKKNVKLLSDYRNSKIVKTRIKE